MYDNIDIDEKVRYLNEIGENILNESDLVEYIVNSIEESGELYWVKSVLQDLDLEYEYYELDGYDCPSPLENNWINDEFEDCIETIIEKTDIKEDYPEIFEEQEDTTSMKL